MKTKLLQKNSRNYLIDEKITNKIFQNNIQSLTQNILKNMQGES